METLTKVSALLCLAHRHDIQRLSCWGLPTSAPTSCKGVKAGATAVSCDCLKDTVMVHRERMPSEGLGSESEPRECPGVQALVVQSVIVDPEWGCTWQMLRAWHVGAGEA